MPELEIVWAAGPRGAPGFFVIVNNLTVVPVPRR
jgi:hypothetical protein